MDSDVSSERLAKAVVGVVAAQAREADLTRTVSRDAVDAIKESGLLGLSASGELGGTSASVADVAAELEMLVTACASTAWCVWNHLCVFHLFCGALGPEHTDLLAGIVENREWVCFPAGAGSGVHATHRGEHLALDGPAAFGSGARYADWAGVAFAMAEPDGTVVRPLDMRFSILRLDTAGVDVRPTWDGSGLRASATDDVVYSAVALPAARAVPWFGANRAAKLRDPDFAVINPRYREDWVGISDVWLAEMGTGVVGAALDEVATEIGGRRALMGRSMTELAGVHFNLGRAAKELAGARAAVTHACNEVDARIAAASAPTEADELRLAAVSAFALEACDRAMHHLLKVVGGNGLRERHPFERRHRDFQSMPLHINAHEDRVTERYGRHLLGLPLDKF
jgi:3-hydroxy-9,10-secoandrosta-1,3,5(10)-triene-9,17-dione monooxygenase